MKGELGIVAVLLVGTAIFMAIVLARLSNEKLGNVGFKGNDTVVTITTYTNETLASTLVNLTRNLTNTNTTSGALSTIIDRVELLANLTEGGSVSPSLINFTLVRTVNPNTINFSDIGFSNNSAINITYRVNVSRAQEGETGYNWTATTRTFWSDLSPLLIFIGFAGLIMTGGYLLGNKR